MIGGCDKCPLPEIYKRMTQAKKATQMASSNATLAESPTEAEPFVVEAKKQLESFQIAQSEYASFIDIWKGTCKKCNFGA